MQYGGSSVSGPRPYNEDAFSVRDLTSRQLELGGLKAFMVVSDGMGGHESGDVASATAIRVADSYIDDLLGMAEQADLNVDPSQALREIVGEGHEAVLKEASTRGASMGATFVGAFISDDRAWIAHVGDSRAYLVRGGLASPITVDHSQVGRMIAEGTLTEEQAQRHPTRNVIERALGFTGAEPDIDVVDLQLGDVLILCSDGMSTVLSGEVMAQIIDAAHDATHAASALTQAAVLAHTDDNATAVVWAGDGSTFSGAGVARRSGRKSGGRAHARAQRTTAILVALGMMCVAGLIALATTGLPVGTVASIAANQVARAMNPSATKNLAPALDPKPGKPFSDDVRAVSNPKDGKVVVRTGPGGSYEPVAELTPGVSRAKAKRVGDWYVLDRPSVTSWRGSHTTADAYAIVWVRHESMEAYKAPAPPAPKKVVAPAPSRRTYTSPRTTRKSTVKTPVKEPAKKKSTGSDAVL